MSTKGRVLELLEKNRGKNLSGEEIAGLLGISRTSVWKAIKSLEQDGYDIQAATNRGYSLSPQSGILSIQGLLPYLSDTINTKKIYIYKSLESTNKTAKEMAINGYEHGTVIIADGQTAGAGRHDRNFYSPPGSGLYMSFLLRTRFLELPRTTTLVTAAAAVAVCRAIQRITAKEAQIKWVNDILLDNKKICGILTEAITNFESGAMDWIIIGIGINVDTDGFPGDLHQIATSIFPDKKNGAIRNRLAAEIINILLSSGTWTDDSKVYIEYKSRMTMLGRVVTVIQPGETYEALAVDIDEHGRLIVRRTDGRETALSSGEVVIKSKAYCNP